MTEAARACAATPGDVAVVLTADAAIQALNKRWRGQDKPTNVLSFPAQAMPGSDEPAHLGDIVIAFETLAAEADRDGKQFAHHLAHLSVHGYLHLLGHDHDKDREAEAMEQLETDILARIGVPDPYAGARFCARGSNPEKPCLTPSSLPPRPKARGRRSRAIFPFPCRR